VAVHVTRAAWSTAAGHLTPTGKPNRAALRRMFADELGEMERAHAARTSQLSAAVGRMVRGDGAAMLAGVAGAPEGACAPLTSLAAVRLASALRAEFGVDVPPALLLRADDPVAAATQCVRAASLLAARAGGAGGAPDVSEWAVASLAGRSVDWEAEATLPEAVRVDAAADAAADATAARHILLTGVTGFLGCHLLQELLERTPADTRVYCLVRAEDSAAAVARLRAAAAAQQLACSGDDATWAARVRVVVGDASWPLFGMAAAEHAALGAECAAVVHCAAGVNMLQPYAALHGPNVAGTEQVLRFACAPPSKALCYASTTSVLVPQSAAVAGPNEVVPLGALDACSGYVQSKCIAERLVLEAQRRGARVGVVRMARIGPHSRTGACNRRDLLTILLRGVMHLGVAPPNGDSSSDGRGPLSDVVPVDRVAGEMAGMLLWLQRPHPAPRPCGLWHVSGCADPLPLGLLLEQVEAAGVPLRRTADSEEWRERLRASADPELALLAADGGALRNGAPADCAHVSCDGDEPARAERSSDGQDAFGAGAARRWVEWLQTWAHRSSAPSVCKHSIAATCVDSRTL
jgi:thioester reductase-like protein